MQNKIKWALTRTVYGKILNQQGNYDFRIILRSAICNSGDLILLKLMATLESAYCHKL